MSEQPEDSLYGVPIVFTDHAADDGPAWPQGPITVRLPDGSTCQGVVVGDFVYRVGGSEPQA